MNLREERNFLDLPCVIVIKDLRSRGAAAATVWIWSEEKNNSSSSDGGGIDAWWVWVEEERG